MQIEAHELLISNTNFDGIKSKEAINQNALL